MQSLDEAKPAYLLNTYKLTTDVLALNDTSMSYYKYNLEISAKTFVHDQDKNNLKCMYV